jgi:hypothetical protein
MIISLIKSAVLKFRPWVLRGNKDQKPGGVIDGKRLSSLDDKPPEYQKYLSISGIFQTPSGPVTLIDALDLAPRAGGIKSMTLREECQQEFLNEISYMRDVGATLAVVLEGAGQCSAMKGRGSLAPTIVQT